MTRVSVRWALGCCTLVLAAPPAAAAADNAAAAVAQALGPWLFASVALVLVAVLAWRLGFAFGRREARREYRSKRADGSPDSIQPAVGNSTPARPIPQTDRDAASAISYALSHDLRAPLRVVEGFARILKEDYGRQLDRIGNDHLDRLLGATARMQTMIDGMLSVAKLSAQPLNRRRISLSQMALDIVGEFQATDPGRQVTVQVAPNLEVDGDATLLRQLMENLLGNAWKYTSRTEDARIQFRATEQNGQRVFEVADNGVGFSMTFATQLFGLFQRLHGQRDFPGTGLGLASALRIVKLHGGTIWAEAEIDKGARFYFTLPG